MEQPSASDEHQVKTIADLNDDCLLEIFHHVPLADLLTIENVCSRWQHVSKMSWKVIRTLACNGRKWYFSKQLGDKNHIEVKQMDIFMKILMSCNKNLRYFYLHATDDEKFNETILTELLTAVAQNCQNLEICEVDKAFSLITDGELYALIRNSKNIKKLVFDRMGPINEEYLATLLDKNQNLKHLSLIKGDQMKLNLLENLPYGLEELNLIDIKIRNSFIFNLVLRKLHNLRALQCSCDDITIRSIINKTSLTKLSLLFNNVPSRSINELNNLVNLVDLDLSFNTCLKDENLISITNTCTNIESLNISGCTSITNDGIFSLSDLPNLQILKMESLDLVTDLPIAYLPNSITHLHCAKCEQIADRGMIKFIRRANRLAKLNVSSCNVTNHIVATAIQMTDKRKNLTLEIDVSFTHVSLVMITNNVNVVCREIRLLS